MIDTSAEAIAAILEGVTEGPWRMGILESWEGETGIAFRRVYFQTSKDGEIQEAHVRGDHCDDNARFIAWAREGVPAIAAERDRLADENARLREYYQAAQAIDAICDEWRQRRAGKGEPLDAPSILNLTDKLTTAEARLYLARAGLKGISHE